MAEKEVYKKLSQLPETDEAYGEEHIPVVQNGKTFKIRLTTILEWLFRLIGVISSVDTFSELKSLPVRYRRGVHVLLESRGGFFVYEKEGSADNVDVFQASDGGFWVRKIDGYSKSEVDTLVVASSTGAVKITGNELPNLGDLSKTTDVYEGTYTQEGQPPIVVSSGNVGRLFWNGETKIWSLQQQVALPHADVPIKSLSVDGVDVPPNENGNVDISIPDAPIKSLSVDGVDVPPNENGNVDISIPDAPIQSLSVDGVDVPPNENGNVDISIPDAPVQSISVNGVDTPPDAQGNVDIDVVVDVDQTIDPNSTNPVSAQAVAAAFDGLSAKYGAAVSLSTSGEEGSEVYAINLLDEAGNVLSTTDQWSGGTGGGGGGGTTKIQLIKITSNPTIKTGEDVVLQYSYDHIDTTTGSSTGLSGKATITVTSGATSETKEVILTAGSLNEILLNKELKVGNNSVRVRVEVDSGETVQVSTINWSVMVVNLVLTSNYDISTLTAKGTSLFIPYAFNGSGNKTIKCYVNGALYESRAAITSSGNGTFTIQTSAYNHGNVRVELVIELELLSGVIKSNSIYYDLIVTQPTSTAPIIATKFNFKDGRILAAGVRPELVAKQFESTNITYAVYNPTLVNKPVSVSVDGVVLASASLPLITTNTAYRSIATGEYSGVIATTGLNYTFGVDVTPSSININEPTDNLVFKFNAEGKSNNDVNRETWKSDTSVTATLTGVKYSGDGWTGTSLKLTDTGRAVINYKPLSAINAITPNSFAFQISMKNTEVVDENVRVVSCVDADGTGFYITPIEAVFVTSGKSTASMKLSYGEVYNIAFVSFPTGGSDSSEYEKINSNMIYLYINGEIVGGARRSSSDGIYQSNAQNVTLGASGATTELYHIRHYNRYLSDSQILDLYLIDLSSVDEVIEKYKFNDVVDGNGEVSVDSLPDDARYVVFTGTTNGVPTAIHAALQNNKDTKYDVTEILHINKADQSLNFKLVGGCIRLQGTSSLAFPTKNDRFYIKNASKVAGDLYLGCDANGNGGTLSAVPKWSFKNLSDSGKKAAPTDVWCLKADFAESSSSHNTGMARLANTTLVKAGDVTPAQKNTAPTYEYDVRTTVDGTPCYLFYRNTVNDTPIFMGKFNLNNDKASEEVFGFKGIPGYHLNAAGTAPSQWIIDNFGGINPTECWEFLNNDFAMGMYLDDDFDSKVEVDGKLVPNWTRVFEARFLEDIDNKNEQFIAGTLKPYYLERLVKWVKSTLGNPAKFRAEVADYFDVNCLCDYFAFTQMFGMVDQMVKNCMIGFWYDTSVNKMLAYYIFYDNDTILGVRNDGRLKYNWDLTRQTIDTEFNRPAYMGHDSVLWNNVEGEMAAEVGAAYRRLRARLPNSEVFRFFHTEQSDKFPERIFNIDALLKYVKPLDQGYQYLEVMQGSRKSHSTWWITNRLAMFDAKYDTGDYRSTDLNFKGISAAGAVIKATTLREFYLTFTREASVMASALVQPNSEWSYTYPQEANIGTIFHLYGSRWISKLNLSEWGGFTDLNIPSMPVLEELILGKDGRTYSLSAIQLADKLPMLKHLDIRNYIGISSLDLSYMGRLVELNARGCTNLTVINFAQGANVNKLTLPQNLRTLKLNGFDNLTNANVLFPDGNNVDNLVVDNCKLIAWETLLASLAKVKNIRVTGVVKKERSSWLNQFNNLGGIDAAGNVVPNPRLVGTLQLTNYIEEAEYNTLRAKFPELEIVKNEYSVYIQLQDTAAPTAFVNTDNNTGYDPNEVIQSNPFVLSGHAKNTINNMKRYLGKHSSTGVQSIIELDNNDSTKYKDGTPANLDGSEGDVWVRVPKYWYKGVSDVLNNRLYICMSSNEDKPKYTADTKIVKLEAGAAGVLEFNINKFLHGISPVLPTSNMINGNSGITNTIKIDIPAGYTKARFPIFPTGLNTASASYTNFRPATFFLNNDDTIIENLMVNEDVANVGSYVIRDIPQGATRIFLTVPAFMQTNNPEDQFVVFGKQDTPIEDFEPRWVKSDARLLTAFPTYYDSNNVMRSVAKSPSDPSAILTEQAILNSNEDSFLATRLWTKPNYEVLKNLYWLFVLDCGTTRVLDVYGDPSNVRNLNLGMTATNGNNMVRANGTANSNSWRGLENLIVSVNYGYYTTTGGQRIGSDTASVGRALYKVKWYEDTKIVDLNGTEKRGMRYFHAYSTFSSVDEERSYYRAGNNGVSSIMGGLYLDATSGSNRRLGSATTYQCLTYSPLGAGLASGSTTITNLMFGSTNYGRSPLTTGVTDAQTSRKLRAMWNTSYQVQEVASTAVYKNLPQIN